MKKLTIVVLVVAALTLTLSVVQAQDAGDRRGTIQGLVYQDVNGDGRCVDTGVAGEGPVANVNVEFASTNSETNFTLYSGPEGIYGAFAMGFSNWQLTAKPSAEWVVTSVNPVTVLIDADNLVATGVNFCVRSTGAVAKTTGAVVYLPQSGGAAGAGGWVTAVAALLGAGFVGTGAMLEWKRRSS